MNDELSVEEVCSDEFLSGKKSTAPSTGPRSGAIGGGTPSRPGMMPRGPPGQPVRPRGAAPGQMFRPQGVRAVAPRPSIAPRPVISSGPQ
jgi:hypothetical protein